MIVVPVAVLQIWDELKTDVAATDVSWDRPPDIVFVGHSYTGSRIDSELLESLLGDEAVSVFWTPQSGPDIWYLMLKNRVIFNGARPKLVITFFEDDQMTRALSEPRNNRQALNRIQNMTEWEPEYDAMFKSVGIRERIRHGANALFPTKETPNLVTIETARMSGLLLVEPAATFGAILRKIPVVNKLTESVGSGKSYVDLKLEMENGLTELKLLTELSTSPISSLLPGASETRRAVNWECDSGLTSDATFCAEQSFIPKILEMGDEYGFKMVFIRARTRQISQFNDYMADLSLWVESNGALFYDLSEREDIKDEWFSDGPHTFGHESEYTQFFYDEFSELLSQ